MRVASVVGTRPQLIKAAALQPILRRDHDEYFIDTGQHWDDNMAGAFFRDLGLAKPDLTLDAGGGSHAEQTAAMLLGLEPALDRERPDLVIVYGDTNSTLAGALAAAKLGLSVAHVEAGLRAYERPIPEEINRVVVDHLSTRLFAPTPTAVDNLRAEGIVDGVVLTGDLMQDLASRTAPGIRDPAILDEIGSELGVSLAPGRYLFATIHRQSNRQPSAIGAWLGLMQAVARPDRPVVVALHPGSRYAMERERTRPPDHVLMVEPQGYRYSLALQLHAAAVLTDSGGVTREAAWLGVPCLVLRDSTEWHEALEGSEGRLVVVGLDEQRASAEVERLAPIDAAETMARRRAQELNLKPAGAAERIVAALEASASAQRNRAPASG
jgi:UDP-N-acetylglucosamine 2-epimerase